MVSSVASSDDLTKVSILRSHMFFTGRMLMHRAAARLGQKSNVAREEHLPFSKFTPKEPHGIQLQVFFFSKRVSVYISTL